MNQTTEPWDVHRHRDELWVSAAATVCHSERGQLCWCEQHWDVLLWHPIQFRNKATAAGWIARGTIGELQEAMSDLSVGFSTKSFEQRRDSQGDKVETSEDKIEELEATLDDEEAARTETLRMLDVAKHEAAGLKLLVVAAKHLLLAAGGPSDGPTNWNETRDRWLGYVDRAASDPAVPTVLDELERLQSELVECRKAHGVLMRGIKAACGLEHWPEGSGPFPEAAVRLLEGRVQVPERSIDVEQLDKLYAAAMQQTGNPSHPDHREWVERLFAAWPDISNALKSSQVTSKSSKLIVTDAYSMGTRADFYIGTGPNAEWLGSVAWDGHEWEEDPCCPLLKAAAEAKFRQAVSDIALVRGDWTAPEQGWPWPWDDSTTTDRAYAFVDGGTKVYQWGEGAEWPNMKARAAVARPGSERSGAMVLSVGKEPAMVPGFDELLERLRRKGRGDAEMRELYRMVAAGERHPTRPKPLPDDFIKFTCQAMTILYEYADSRRNAEAADVRQPGSDRSGENLRE